jgi:hypothetical protein
MFNKKLAALAVGLIGSIAAVPAHAIDTPVALELALLVDISGSVDDTEYALQKSGYVNAFNNAVTHARIAGVTGGIAVTYIEWSGANQQYQLVDWTVLTDAASSEDFADAIAATTRAGGGAFNLTAPGSAINYAAPLFSSNSYAGGRWVIDVSGDGEQNDGANTAAARDAFLAVGGQPTSVNGLAIGGAGLVTWYEDNIKGGTAGTSPFVIQAANFADFEGAVLTKIGREINPTPEPGSLLLMGAALAGVFGVRRRVKSA